MSADHDLERRIADFYANEQRLRAPDRVLAEALTTIESTPQRRGFALARWRLPPMTGYTKFATAAAAVGIVAATAFAAVGLQRKADDGVASSPSPTATSTATASPTPTSTSTALASKSASPTSANPLPVSNTPLDIGRYSLDVPGFTRSVELTIGEAGWRGNGWYVNSDMSSVSFWTVDDVFDDACSQSFSSEPVGPTVDDLASALDAQLSTDMEELSNPVVGGHPSTRVVMRPSESIESSCPAEELALWQDVDKQPPLRSIPMTPGPDGQEDVVWMIDVDGDRLVVVAYYNESDPTQSASLQALIDSIQFVQR